MLDYAIKITRTPVDCDEPDIERLRELGFSLDDIYDIKRGCGAGSNLQIHATRYKIS